MQKKTMVHVRVFGNWVQQLLDVRLPVGNAYGSAQQTSDKPVHL